MECSIAAALDLTAAAADVQARRSTAADLIEHAIAATALPASAHAFIATTFDEARSAASAADRARADGRDSGSLSGLSVSIKDLFDVEGQVTAAGSTLLADAPPAHADAPAVARLRAAGAAIIGRTNMSEFAFSGIGINPHHGTPLNAATARIDAIKRIPGGSSSGGAVSVASGAAWAALGSDTGGSIRIPAALHGLVGFKSTARLVPTAGSTPLSPTLDTACAITRSVRDAVLLHAVLSARPIDLAQRPLARFRFAVPQTVMLDGLDPTVARAFDRSLARLKSAGASIEHVALEPLSEVAAINASGGFAAAESWAFHRRWLTASSSRYDPRVALRIRRGEAMSAADYIELLAARRDWIQRMEIACRGFDAMLSPTVPVVAPPLAPLVDDDAAFFAANAAVLRNPSIVNLLDGCAISLPCHVDGELPVGLMVWSSALRDDVVLDAALAIEATLAAA